MNPEPLAALHPGRGRQVGHALVGGDVLGPAVGIAGVVEGVDTDEDVARGQDLGPGECEGQEDGVAGRHIGDGDALLAQCLRVAALGHGDIGGEGGAAEAAQVDIQDDMLGHSQRLRHPLGGLQFNGVPLAIAKGQGIGRETLGLGDGKHGRGIQTAAQ